MRDLIKINWQRKKGIMMSDMKSSGGYIEPVKGDLFTTAGLLTTGINIDTSRWGNKNIVRKAILGCDFYKRANTLPKKYIINNNAAILFWADGSKTISKRNPRDEFDKEIGFLFGCWQHYNKDKSRNLRKKILDCIKQDMMKEYLFQRFRVENSMTVEEARKYLRDLKVESSNKIEKKQRVMITDPGYLYSTYDNFITGFFPTYRKYWKSGEHPDRNKVYRVIGKEKHQSVISRDLALIQDEETKQVFIMGVKGLKEVK